MPHRHKFPAEYFETNPMEGEDLDTVYKRLQWGNTPRNRFRIEAPEPLAALGTLAAIQYVNGAQQKFQEDSFFVAVGKDSNRVYFLPITPRRAPEHFPRNFYARIRPYGQVKRTDYLSDKGTDDGGESGYYYHNHERPYPVLYGTGSHFVLIPQKLRTGGRSYAVNDEGIIG